MGPIPAPPIIVEDLNGDGKKEIIFGTAAVNNGVECNGMPDDQSYLIALDWRGREMWKRLLGGWYTTIFTSYGDLNGDGKPEIVATKEVHRAREKESGEIWIFDLQGNLLREKAEDLSFSYPQIVKWRGRNFIYVGDSSGRVRIFDDKLRVSGEINLGKPTVVVKAGERWPMVLASTSERLYFLSKDLRRVLYSFEYRDKFKFVGLNLYAPNRIKFFDFSDAEGLKGILLADYIYEVRYAVPSWTSYLKTLFKWPIYVYILLLLGVNLLFIISGGSQAKEVERGSETEEALQEMAHKLKTPMTILIWSVEKLKKDLKENKVEPELLDSIMDEIEVLDSGVKNIVRLASLRTLKKETFNISALLESLVSRYRQAAPPDIMFKLEIEENVFIYGNKEAMEEALANLLDNAVEAIEDGGKIMVSLYTRLSLSRGKKAIIEITDTGPGIRKEHLQKIFKPNFSTKKSMGIGLTITKRVIEIHGGKIEVQTKLGFGTKFTVTLPSLEIKNGRGKDTDSR